MSVNAAVETDHRQLSLQFSTYRKKTNMKLFLLPITLYHHQ